MLIMLLWVFAGFIDGNGYIYNRVRKSGYIESNLSINFNIRDMDTFKYFQSKLGFGSIVKLNNTLSLFRIYWFELFYIIVPLLINNNIWFLTTNRNNQYNQ